MTTELALRFVLGGVIVSMFAAAGETFKPKTFAGLFGAAPSVAITTLLLAFVTHGPGYVAVEARSMLIDSLAFFVYSAICVAATKRRAIPVWVGAGLAWGAWGVAVFAGWKILALAGVFA